MLRHLLLNTLLVSFMILGSKAQANTVNCIAAPYGSDTDPILLRMSDNTIVTMEARLLRDRRRVQFIVQMTHTPNSFWEVGRCWPEYEYETDDGRLISSQRGSLIRECASPRLAASDIQYLPDNSRARTVRATGCVCSTASYMASPHACRQ